MSRIPHITIITAAVALLAGGVAVAQNTDPAAQSAAAPKAMRTVAEMQQRVRERTANIDANQDGFITAQEQLAQREAMQAKRAQRRLARLDSNGDGQVSTAEFETGQLERIAKLDTNGDGSLSREEMRSARKHGRFGHGGGFQGPR